MTTVRTTMPVFNDDIPDNLRLAISKREHFHNSRAAEATRVCIFEFQDADGVNFIVFAHNGIPFESEKSPDGDPSKDVSCTDKLINCMSHNTSYGDFGALGNGMKYTMKLTDKSNDPKNTILTVLSRDDDGTFIGAKAYDGGSAYVVESVKPDVVKFITEHFEQHMEDDLLTWANVFYINRVSNFNTTRNDGVLFMPDHRALSELISDDILDSFTDGIRIANNSTAKKKGMARTKG